MVGVVIHRWRRFVSAEGNTSLVINGFESSEGNDGDLAEVEPVVVYSSVRRRPPSLNVVLEMRKEVGVNEMKNPLVGSFGLDGESIEREGLGGEEVSILLDRVSQLSFEQCALDRRTSALPLDLEENEVPN